jgi:hypothetical protein
MKRTWIKTVVLFVLLGLAFFTGSFAERSYSISLMAGCPTPEPNGQECRVDQTGKGRCVTSSNPRSNCAAWAGNCQTTIIPPKDEKLEHEPSPGSNPNP